MIRREFLKLAAASCIKMPGSWSDLKVEADTSFKASDYSKQLLLERLVVGRKSFLKDVSPEEYNLEIALMLKYDIPVITVRCNASIYSNFDHFDAFPDPGHINYRKIHPLIFTVNEFDKRFQKENIKDFKKYRVFIRIRKN